MNELIKIIMDYFSPYPILLKLLKSKVRIPAEVGQCKCTLHLKEK